VIPGLILAQSAKETEPYQQVKLKKVELDIFQSLYTQDGDHSAVTGGHGSESLSDYATNIELNLLMDGKKEGNENSLTLKFGVDAYTSASSDMINPNTISSASYSDVRIYPAIAYNHSNFKGRYDIGTIISYSNEYDYESVGLGLNLSKRSKNNNSEIGLNLQTYVDRADIIYPYELRPQNYPDGSDDGGPVDKRFRYSNTASIVFSQVINKRLQASILVDGVYQNGFLSTSFNRTTFVNEVFVENLPDVRIKLPIGARLNYFAGDNIIAKVYYRYYMDSWGITAHTFSLEVPVKIKPWFSVYPAYRYHKQSGMDYFYLPESDFEGQEFYSNDYDLSGFDSHFMGLGFRIAPPNGIFNAKDFIKNSELNIKYGYYDRSDGLNSHILSLHMKFVAETHPYSELFKQIRQSVF